jgi:catechol 2,3-dioxygenase-like lactoylglutathione lyase family enzyme
MSTIRVAEFNVAAVYVDDLAAAERFYVEHLGFARLRPLGPGVLLGVPDQLTLYLEGGHERVETPQADRHAHVSLCLSAAEGCRKAFERLREAGVPLCGAYEDLGPEFGMFRVFDPAGNIIEFAGKP